MRTVSVTEEDIKWGTPRTCYSCPVALALCRELGWHGADVTERFVTRIDEEGDSVETFCTPAVVTRFVKAFDANRPVKPFSFTLPG